MELVSWQFALFSAVVVGVYYLLSRRAQNIWLLIASYAFYLTFGWTYPVILLGVTLLNFFLAWQVEREAGTGRKSALWLGMGLNLFALLAFRFIDSAYGGRFLAVLDLGPERQSELTRALLPIGFSFYMLQTISYLVDVSRKQLPASRNLVDFALSLAYFPKLTAGPIERVRSFLPRLAQSRQVDNAGFAAGFTLIVLGLVRKVLIADTLTRLLPDGLFREPGNFSSLVLGWGILVYALVLYNDFAGYTNLVRGISALMGIELVPNFQQPYFSRSFTEFWNRWHLSLSFWLRDYIFFPLSRYLLKRYPNPRHPANLVLPSMAAMLASGVWHGLSLGMIAWGGLHGIYQVVERLWGANRPRRPAQQQPRWEQTLKGIGTFLMITLAWVPFATNDLDNALVYWQGLFSFRAAGMEPAVELSLAWVIPLALVSFGLDWAQYHSREELVFNRWAQPARVALLALAIAAVVFALGQGVDVSGFVYQGF